MNRMIALTLAATLLPAGVAARQLPDSLTVEEAVSRVLATHPAVAEAQHGVAASEARIDERQSAFSPMVVAEGSYSRVGPVPTLDFNGESFSLFPSNNYQADVALRHTVFDWGRRRTAVTQARSLARTASENVELVKSRLAYATVDAFYGILFLQESLRVQDEEIASLSRHLEITRGKIEAGTATDFEALSTQVRIASARSRRVDIANALDARTIELRQLLGVSADEALHLAGDFELAPAPLGVDSLVAVAREQRPDLRMARNAEASARVQTQLAALGDRPSVNLNVMVGAKNGYVPNLNRIKPNFVAGMAVQVPVYVGDRTRSQVKAAEAGVDVATARAESLERSVAEDVEKAVAGERANREKIETADVQVRQATAALELARTRYQAGVVTNLDVLDAETLLAQAKLLQIRARYDLVRSRYQLRRAVGDRIW
ncbi:MAG: TolC family protein [Gemmatimonadota bacterium]|jgi:outer membrane protein TolC